MYTPRAEDVTVLSKEQRHSILDAESILNSLLNDRPFTQYVPTPLKDEHGRAVYVCAQFTSSTIWRAPEWSYDIVTLRSSAGMTLVCLSDYAVTVIESATEKRYCAGFDKPDAQSTKDMMHMVQKRLDQQYAMSMACTIESTLRTLAYWATQSKDNLRQELEALSPDDKLMYTSVDSAAGIPNPLNIRDWYAFRSMGMDCFAPQDMQSEFTISLRPSSHKNSLDSIIAARTTRLDPGKSFRKYDAWEFTTDMSSRMQNLGECMFTASKFVVDDEPRVAEYVSPLTPEAYDCCW